MANLILVQAIAFLGEGAIAFWEKRSDRYLGEKGDLPSKKRRTD